jgi:hypothetical protein
LKSVQQRKTKILETIGTIKREQRMKRKTMSAFLGVVAAMSLCGGSLLAQDADVAGPGGPGGGRPGGNFDPSQFRQRMMEQIRTNLNVTNDDEWTVIQTRVEKVMQTRREVEVRSMGMGGPGGPPPNGGPGGGPPGGFGGRGGFGPQASEEQKALQKALEDNAPAAQIKEALAKLRVSRKDRETKLAAAQADLRNVLASKQEARAVLMGLLP